MRRQLVALVGLLAACMPRAELTVLDAAEVPLPDPIERLGVVNRAVEAGQASLLAVAGVEAALDGGVGMEAVQALVPGAWSDGPLPVEAIRATCDAAGVAGLVMLEALEVSSDLVVTSEEPPAAEEDSLPRIRAERSATVRSSWRVVDCAGTVLDEVTDVDVVDRWVSDATDELRAKAGVPGGEAATLELSRSAGAAYGQRIAPTWSMVQRNFYVMGDPRLRAARFRVVAADWKGAMDLWHQVAQDHPDPQVRSRALYDLALGWEVRGQPALAVRNAERAVSEHDSRRARRYLEVLRARQIDSRPLRASTAGEEGAEDP